MEINTWCLYKRGKETSRTASDSSMHVELKVRVMYSSDAFMLIVCCHGNIEKMKELNCDIRILYNTLLAGC